MTGQIISHYRVLDQIGAGGMGVVYRAEDMRLGRHVALKFLPPELSRVPSALERFRREAESVASLNHPHICTLYDIGEHDGRQFLVFELIEGRSLKELIAHAPLAVGRVVELSIELADALDTAHARGIVHRDIKPANILVTARGTAKLLDFGVAWLGSWPGSTAGGEVTREQLTSPGGWIGTAAYMAPEQARGEPPDTRSDLFALGAVMFEMVTRQQAFAGISPGASIEAVLNKTAARPASINPDAPAELERIIVKALEKDPELRYQTARDLLADLKRLVRNPPSAHPAASAENEGQRDRRRSGVVTGAAILALVMAVVMAVVITGWWVAGDRFNEPSPLITDSSEAARLVVLPFENLTRRPDDDWLAGAFSDTVSAGLQSIETLILVPRERVVELFAAEAQRESAPLSADLARELSRKLRVRFYVHGSYQKVGDNLQVVARLVDVKNDAIAAQETLTDQFVNVLQMEGLLARRFAARLDANPLVDLRSELTADLDAYRLVTEARALYAVGRFVDARAILQNALARDPRYALAWAMLSKTNSRLASPASGGRPSPEGLQATLDEATRSAALAPNLVEAQIALALAYRSLLDFGGLQAAAERAVALGPRNGEARVILGDAFSISPGFGCRANARPERAEAEYREGIRIDPLLGSSYLSLTTQLWWMDRPVEALINLEEGITAQPRNLTLRIWHPFNLVFAGKPDDAEALLGRRDADGMAPTIADTLIWGYIALSRNRFDDAAARFQIADAQGIFANTTLRLITSVALFKAGRSIEGAAHLTRAVQTDPDCGKWAMVVPVLAPYRNTPAFVQALSGRHP